MNLIDILKLKFPQCNFIKDVILQDDGEGVYIWHWGLPEPKPDLDQIAEWAEELEPEYQKQQNKIANAPIYKQLEEIDAKSIRALRTNDNERLAELEAEAVVLRGQLL